MEAILNIMKPFFENPEKEYYIREISRIVKVNHTTVRQKLNDLVKEGFLQTRKGKIYPVYIANLNKKFLNLKIYYNLEKLRKSGIVESLEKKFEYPVIVVFGSYSDAMDNHQSDVDIAIISNTKKDFDTKKYRKKIGRDISLHIFSKKEWENTIENHPRLVNNISNGIVVSGELEIVNEI